jgi:4-methylaminobutanoate oxidase (formaldehyde-forming)
MDKGDFIGRAALASARERGLERRMVCIVLDDPRAVTLGSEPVRLNGEVRGRVTSGGYGYAVERSIAYAYLPAELAEAGTDVEVEVFGDWVAGRVTPEPLYDPKGERIRS